MSNVFDNISNLWEERLNDLMKSRNISREEAYNILCKEMDESAKDPNHRTRVRTIVRKNENQNGGNQPANE